MVIEFFKGGADSQLEEIEGTILEMLLDCRHTFDLAINTLVGGTEPQSVADQVRETDRSVNKAQRRVRKALVVHASVRGTDADLPLVLSSMSIVKDAERIGDYAKNILDISLAGIDLSTATDFDVLAWRDRTSAMLADAAKVFRERDVGAAHDLIQRGDDLQVEYDEFIDRVLGDDAASGPDAAARVLLARYLKRITAHTVNVLTSLVMPVHRLDFYDEDKADRVD